jgi:mannose-6-phosphate isomerase-like protein (cupin superfamily)
MAEQNKPTKRKSLPIPKYICTFPFKPDEKRPARITTDTSAQHLYGFQGRWNEVYTFVSTDKITMSLYYLAPNGYVDPPGLHAHGDEYYHIVEGEAVVLNPKTGVSVHLNVGDTVYIPQATRHQIFNFGGKRLGVISILAPVPWKDDGMGTSIPPVTDTKWFAPGVDMKKAKFDGNPF